MKSTGMNQMSVLERRRIQGEVIEPMYKEMADRFGHEQAASILEQAIRKSAIAEARRFKDASDPNQSVMERFIGLYELWKMDGALDMEVLQESETRFDFNVRRCRYAEMYREMGLAEIRYLQSCNGDGSFCERFDPGLKLERRLTLMLGDDCCTFRYRLEPAESEVQD